MRLRKKVMAVLLSAAMIATTVCIPEKNVQTVSASSFNNLNQTEITKAMGAGWNLGNQLEASSNGTPNETAYGNPKINEELILAVKDAGFKSIRIPVSYLSMIDDSNGYKIDSSWLDRVKQVVDMCVDNGLYAIVNMHGDGYTTVSGGWLLCGNGEQTKIKAKYKACWEQIADTFKNYDEHLIFESMNEEFDGTYGNPSYNAYANINAYNQIFVDTVRKSGGNNDKRWLLIPGWNTNINYTADNYGFEMPSDKYLSSSIPSGQKRIMVSVHYYDPWDFCGTESSTCTQWGEKTTNSSKVASWGDESYMASQLKKMNSKFVANGYPVVVGEFGAIDKSAFDSQNAACRADYYEKFCYYSDMYGIIPVAWDNGYNGNYGFGLFDRYSYKVTQQSVINAIMEIYGDSSSATATGIKLDQTSMIINIGDEKKQLNATLTPADSKDKITWKSSDEEVATVNSKGQVTAVNAGTCKITASVPLGYSASCEVTVPKANYVRAKLYLLETASWQSVVSDEYVDIYSKGGTFSLSLDATQSQLSNIGSLYIRDINVGDEDASAFNKATIKVSSIEVNGTTYSMKNDTFLYDTSKKASDDGLTCPIFNFSFINVWANTHVNNVTVENGNYKAYFNNVSYQTLNNVKINFTVSDIDGNSATAEPTAAPTIAPTVTPTVTPTVAPTATPTVTPTVTPSVAPTVTPTVTPSVAPPVAPTATPTVAPSDSDDITGSVKLESDWGSGGIVTISLKNNTSKTFTSGWTVEFTLSREITSMWSGNCESLGNNRYRVSNPAWSGYWGASDTITLNGAIGSGSGTPVITDIKLVK